MSDGNGGILKNPIKQPLFVRIKIPANNCRKCGVRVHKIFPTDY